STHAGDKDVAGTALFTYGIAWGIRQGYFDKKQVLPVIARAWNALVLDKDLGDYERGCFLLAGSEVYQLAPPPAANLDESKVPPYEEPDLLVTTVQQWEKEQRPSLYHLFEKNVYGRMPTRTVPVKVSVTAVDSSALGGLAIRKELTLWFSSTDTTARLRVVLYLPNKSQGPAPVFVGYSFGGNATLEGSSQWPLKEIITRGYGVASAWYWDIEPDRADGWQTGIRTSLSEELQIEPNEWSAIGAWAWGLDRIADYLETDRRVDRHRLIVIGHSRLGKTALWAGAGDPRWAAVI
ncbi:MAG: glycoside hydrolase family 88 protein, partial [Chitinophaga rupis]